METRKWDKINIETSLLGFGCMRFKTINGKIDENKALELIDKAYKSKINYFDTAIPYTDGQNEAFVGKALKNIHAKVISWQQNSRWPVIKQKKKRCKQ